MGQCPEIQTPKSSSWSTAFQRIPRHAQDTVQAWEASKYQEEVAPETESRSSNMGPTKSKGTTNSSSPARKAKKASQFKNQMYCQSCPKQIQPGIQSRSNPGEWPQWLHQRTRSPSYSRWEVWAQSKNIPNSLWHASYHTPTAIQFWRALISIYYPSGWPTRQTGYSKDSKFWSLKTIHNCEDS